MVALTKDVRLLLDESATVSARIPNLLPLQGFYMGGPLLLTVLYLRLQFCCCDCGAAWGAAGGFPDGQTPRKTVRGNLMGQSGSICAGRGSSFAAGDGGVQVGETAGVLGGAGTVFLFWLRYLVMQDYRGPCCSVSADAGGSGGFCNAALVARVLRPEIGRMKARRNFCGICWGVRVPVAVGLVVF